MLKSEIILFLSDYSDIDNDEVDDDDNNIVKDNHNKYDHKKEDNIKNHNTENQNYLYVFIFFWFLWYNPHTSRLCIMNISSSCVILYILDFVTLKEN